MYEHSRFQSCYSVSTSYTSNIAVMLVQRRRLQHYLVNVLYLLETVTSAFTTSLKALMSTDGDWSLMSPGVDILCFVITSTSSDNELFTVKPWSDST